MVGGLGWEAEGPWLSQIIKADLRAQWGLAVDYLVVAGGCMEEAADEQCPLSTHAPEVPVTDRVPVLASAIECLLHK